LEWQEPGTECEKAIAATNTRDFWRPTTEASAKKQDTRNFSLIIKTGFEFLGQG
jgi:hypothetical protein